MRRRSPRTIVLPGFVRAALKYFLIFLAAVIVLTLVVIGVRIAREWHERTWYGVEPFRVLLLEQTGTAEPTSVQVLSVWPETKQVVLLKLPPEVHVSGIGGYGSTRLGALTELGRIEHVGDRIIKDAVMQLLGVPIHFSIRNGSLDNPLRLIKNRQLSQAIQAKTSMAEAIDVLRLLNGISAKSVSVISMADANAVRQTTEADGSIRLYLEPALVDWLVRDQLAGIWSEAAAMQVAVINATGKPTMATQWSRLFRFSGFDVVSVTEQQENLDTSTIVVSKELEHSLEVKVMQQLLPWANVIVGDPSPYRADVAVLVGLDSWKFLNDREWYLGSKY